MCSIKGILERPFPRLRPPPYQKPHPPLVRACIGEQSMLEMAKIGGRSSIGIQTLDTLRQRLQRYKNTMCEAGFDEEAVEKSSMKPGPSAPYTSLIVMMKRWRQQSRR